MAQQAADDHLSQHDSGSSDEDVYDNENMVPGGADEEWDDWESGDEGDGEPACSLFDNTMLPSPVAAMDHDAKTHGFDLRHFITQAGLSDYGVLQVINYIRTEVAAARDPRPQLSTATPSSSPRPWESDSYLIPVKPEDAMLCYDYEEWTGNANGQAAATACAGKQQVEVSGSSAGGESASVQRENKALKAEVEELRAALETLQAAVLSARGLLLEADSAPGPSTATAGGSSSSSQPAQQAESAAQASTSGRDSTAVVGARGRDAQHQKRTQTQEVDDSYFDSYSGFNIHREMISDKPRTEAYRDALERNPSLVRGKTVLDVGCGTGILSLFACRGGAQTVVSVDGSQRIAGFARQIAQQAGYSAEQGGPMHVVCSKLEELNQLPGGVDKVDVIVSEWMGYALLFETMLDSVLVARDRWLRPGGVVLPDIATIFFAGADSGAFDLDFWKDVYGFSMAPIADDIHKAQKTRASVLPVEAKHLVTNTVTAKVLDLVTMTSEDQDFTCDFTLTALNPTAVTQLAAITLWFDTAFSAARCPEHAVTLSTSPHAPLTHWVQTVLPLDAPITLVGSGVTSPPAGTPYATSVTGRLSMSRNKAKHRSLDIALQYSATLSDGSVRSHAGIYPMSVLD